MWSEGLHAGMGVRVAGLNSKFYLLSGLGSDFSYS